MMLKRLSRLFTIKTRFEAFLVTYAIAVGAVERGRHYMDVYPGNMGLLLAVICTGVVFIAGAKLLDSVRPAEPVLIPARATPRAAGSVVIDPGEPRSIPPQGHQLHITQIDPGPGDNRATGERRAQIECAIGIGECHSGRFAGRRCRVERLPLTAANPANRQRRNVAASSIDDRKARRPGQGRHGQRQRKGHYQQQGERFHPFVN